MDEILNKIDQAFDNENNQVGLQLLRLYTQNFPDDIDQFYRLAVIEEQIGSLSNAENAYLHCLNSNKKSMIAHLYAGYFFQQQGRMEKALAIYSLGHDLDANLTQLHWSTKAAYDTRLRSYTADIALKEHFSKLHLSSLSLDDGTSKVQQAIYPQTHNHPFEYLHKRQRPHVFYIPGLLAKPVHQNKLHKWCLNIEENYDLIKKECANLIDLMTSNGAPYIDKTFKQKEFSALAGSKNWTALHLYHNGIPNNDLLTLMPLTSELLNKLPLYNLNEYPYEVFFSLLKAGQHIKPHYGLSNHSLTVHLPIVVPESGYLRVENVKINWQEGKVIIFDDSFDHEAINTSNEDRVVLIFSVWHNDLSEKEKEDIQRSFQSKQNWLNLRTQQLL